VSTTNEPASTVHSMQVPELEAARIGFSVTNKKKPTTEFAYIYMTDNRRDAEPWGHLEISIQNPDSKPIVITDASRLEIEVPEDLLSLPDLRLIQLETQSETNWTLVVKDNNVLQLKLKPGRTISISKDSPAIVLLQGALAPIGKALERSFTFVWSGFEGIKDNSRGFRVVREFIPHESRNARFECKWAPRDEYRGSDDDVYVTPSTVKVGFPGIENRLILTLVNSEGAELKTTPDTEFVVSFTTDELGDPISALCTNEQLKDTTCKHIVPPGKTAWKATKQDQGKTIRWLLTPPPAEKVLEKHAVSFEFKLLVTKMAIAPASPVLIHWRGIEGCNPGYAVTTVSKKEAYPYVRSLEATLNGRKLNLGEKVDFKDPVQLEWELFAADGCTISTLPGTFGWKGTAMVSPEQEISEFKLEPRITLDAHVKTGEPKIAVVGVKDPEIVSISATEAGLLPSRVTMTWECKSGDCFLSGPGLPRVQVDRSGSRIVDADRSPFLLECAGFKTVTRQLYVQIPPVQCSIEVEWLPAARKGRWKWKTFYARTCSVAVSTGETLREISTALTGTFDNESDSTFMMMVYAEGNGIALALCAVFPTDKVLPEVHFQSLKEPSGPNHRITWQFLHAPKCEIRCLEAGRDYFWETDEAIGQKEFNYENKWHAYGIGIAIDPANPRAGCIFMVGPYGRISAPADRTSFADLAQAVAHYYTAPDTEDAPRPLMEDLLHKLLGG